MNIFYLDEDPELAANYHVDKHVVKMILELAQLLSTAHRILDGEKYITKNSNGRKVTRYSHQEDLLYNATHINHPCNKWVRSSIHHYNYTFKLFKELCKEYTFRYGKVHKTEAKLMNILSKTPKNISQGNWVQPQQAMPDDCKEEDSVSAYRNYYIKYKSSFAKWTKRNKPGWFV